MSKKTEAIRQSVVRVLDSYKLAGKPYPESIQVFKEDFQELEKEAKSHKANHSGLFNFFEVRGVELKCGPSRKA